MWMPFAPNTSARRGPMPLMYWTEVDNSSIPAMLAGSAAKIRLGPFRYDAPEVSRPHPWLSLNFVFRQAS